MDERLSELEKAGDLGFHWIEMQRACNLIVEKHVADFQHVIGKLDRKVHDHHLPHTQAIDGVLG